MLAHGCFGLMSNRPSQQSIGGKAGWPLAMNQILVAQFPHIPLAY